MWSTGWALVCVTVGSGTAKLQFACPALTLWLAPETVVWVTLGSGTAKDHETFPALTAWSVAVGVVCVTVGWGTAKLQPTFPASTVWSTVTGGGSSVVARMTNEYAPSPTSFVALNRKSYSVLASSPEKA